MSHTGTRVVAHMRDGTLIRGRTHDFRPGRRALSVTTATDQVRVRVPVSELKALFFVRSLAGNPNHVKKNAFDAGPNVGRRVWVVFADGEELAGRVLSVKSDADGFFLFPADPESNLERAWIVVSNTTSVLFDEDATEASHRWAAARSRMPVGAIVPDRWDDMLRLKSIATPEPWTKALPTRRTRRESDIFLGDW